MSVLATPSPVHVSKTEEDDNLVLSTDQLMLSISNSDGAIRFLSPDGSTLLAASGIGTRSVEPVTDSADTAYHVRQDFTLAADEGIYGLGQFEDGTVNYRDHDILVAQANRTAVNPFLVSSRGYGILWDNPSKTRFRDAGEETFFWSEIADGIDYYFVYGPALDSVVAGYRHLTGRAPLFGKWAYGYWQSKERYKSSDELIGVLKEYRRRGIPIDNIIQDWSYWGNDEHFSGMEWDTAAYPHPAAMIDTLHANNAHVAVSIWPAFGRKTALYQELDSLKLLFDLPHWNKGKVYDAFHPQARGIYWRYLKKGLFDAGVDGYWMDATEPEFRCTDDRFITDLSMKSAGRTFLGGFSRYLNAYSLMTTQGVYEHQREVTDRKRVFILTRSSFTGQQRYGATTWSGDTFASWDDLKVQIAAAVNFSMSGIPYWTNDIGGFITEFHFPHGLDDPAYKELYVRWFQFGAFCPIFRAHGTNIPREIWRFGQPGEWAYDALVSADRLRYRLMPYIYSLAGRVTHDDYSFIRGLVMDFPADRNVRSIADQYMFGLSMMICPVTSPMRYPPSYDGVDITPDHFYSPDGSEHGMNLEVYRGTEFEQLILSRKTDASQIAWTGCLPIELDTAYSLRMYGRVMSEQAGTYAFSVIADGGVRLTVGGSRLIDQWAKSSRSTYAANIPLASRAKVPFLLEYRQPKHDDCLLKVNWTKPGPASVDTSGRDVYLPEGAHWYDFWSGRLMEGGHNIHAAAPLEHLPIFVPAGSIIPVGPDLHYATEAVNGHVELRVYPGRDADFTVYDDDGASYDYEKGACTRIPIHWNQEERTLTLGALQGDFPGARRTVSFAVVIVREGHGAGDDLTPDPDRIVLYEGTPVAAPFPLPGK